MVAAVLKYDSELSVEDVASDLWVRLRQLGNATDDSILVSASYIYTSVRNVMIDHARKEKRRAKPPIRRNRRTWLHDVMERHPEKVTVAFTQLTPLMQRTIQMFIYEGISAEDIARREGVTPAAIRKRRSRALDLLRAYIDGRE